MVLPAKNRVVQAFADVRLSWSKPRRHVLSGQVTIGKPTRLGQSHPVSCTRPETTQPSNTHHTRATAKTAKPRKS